MLVRDIMTSPAVTIRHTLGGEIWAACGQLGGLSPAA